MPENKLEKLARDIKEIMPDNFPELNNEISVNANKPKSFTIEPTISEPELSANPLNNYFKSRNWSELSNQAEKLLTSDPENPVTKLYWLVAQFNLRKIPAEILNGTLAELLLGPAVTKTVLEREWGIVSAALLIGQKEPGADKLAVVFEKLQKLVPQLVGRLLESYLAGQLAVLELAAKTAPQNSDVFKKISYLESLQKNRGTKVKLTEVVEEKKRSAKYPYFILALLALLIVYYFYPRTPKTEVARKIIPSDVNFAEPKINVNIELPPPTTMKLNEPPDINDIIKELESTPTQNQPIASPVAKLPSKGELDLSGPREPVELRELLNSGYDESRERSNTQAERGEYIIRGDTREDPIVSGQPIPGAKTWPKLINGDPLKVKTRTSLFDGPDEIEAEIVELYPGDRLIFIKDYKEWVKVEFRGRQVGYVKKRALEIPSF